MAAAIEAGGGPDGPLRFRGLHLHVGSQLGAADAWRDAVRRALALLALLRGGLPTFDTLDVGGGFPVAPLGVPVPEPGRFARELPALLAAIPTDRRPGPPRGRARPRAGGAGRLDRGPRPPRPGTDRAARRTCPAGPLRAAGPCGGPARGAHRRPGGTAGRHRRGDDGAGATGPLRRGARDRRAHVTGTRRGPAARGDAHGYVRGLGRRGRRSRGDPDGARSGEPDVRSDSTRRARPPAGHSSASTARSASPRTRSASTGCRRSGAATSSRSATPGRTGRPCARRTTAGLGRRRCSWRSTARSRSPVVAADSPRWADIARVGADRAGPPSAAGAR